MKQYKIIINAPNKQYSEISIDEEDLKKIEPFLNARKMIRIYDDYINTAYIVMISIDMEATSRENRRLQDEAENKKRIEDLRIKQLK